MYKVVCEVVKVSEPKPMIGDHLHVTQPCSLYKVGDKMTFAMHPMCVMVMEETDRVCMQALSGILPMIRPSCMGAAEDWDWIDTCKYFACPDGERPVIFEIKRVKMKPPVQFVTKYEHPIELLDE